jgi:hypothetical protein
MEVLESIKEGEKTWKSYDLVLLFDMILTYSTSHNAAQLTSIQLRPHQWLPEVAGVPIYIKEKQPIQRKPKTSALSQVYTKLTWPKYLEMWKLASFGGLHAPKVWLG